MEASFSLGRIALRRIALRRFAVRRLAVRRLAVPLAAALAIAGCGRSESARGEDGPRPAGSADSAGSVPGVEASGGLRHAEGFARTRSGDTTFVTVRRPWQGARGDRVYRLVPRGAGAGRGGADAETLTVPVPVARAATLTTTNLRHMEWTGALDALAGVGGARYICSPAVRARLADGRIRDVGEEMHLDLEALARLRPDLVFTFVVGGTSDGSLGKLSELRLPAVIDGSYMEETPLGRAEWIKFTAGFFGRDAAADSVFAGIDSAYQALKAVAAKAERRPTVLVGAPFGGTWWVPSGRTYVARLLADAGADYAWADDTTRGSLNLDLEAVLARAGGAEVWLNAGDWADLEDARAKDPRFALFRAWREGAVWTNDKAACAGGGRDFFESGAARPDWVLADLIAVLHPGLLPGHETRFYRRLPAGAKPEKRAQGGGR